MALPLVAARRRMAQYIIIEQTSSADMSAEEKAFPRFRRLATNCHKGSKYLKKLELTYKQISAVRVRVRVCVCLLLLDICCIIMLK